MDSGNIRLMWESKHLTLLLLVTTLAAQAKEMPLSPSLGSNGKSEATTLYLTDANLSDTTKTGTLITESSQLVGGECVAQGYDITLFSPCAGEDAERL